ncbi:MAG TPA: putative molybdenum carrier protein [Isosphaeraceae bacterium]|nr:putative molybdenum carrier protein [Isosphaeraceae bacterium]
MPGRIVSGGQAGADRAGWRAARAFGIRTGGRMPRGSLTEDGPRPEQADRYGARALPTSGEPERTGAHVRDSDATPRSGSTDTPGARATFAVCRRGNRPASGRRRGGARHRQHVPLTAQLIIYTIVSVLNR